MENKQIVVNKNLHKNFKKYCADKEENMKEYTEALLEFAIFNDFTIEKLREKQYADSLSSTQIGGPMIRYGNNIIDKNDSVKNITSTSKTKKDTLDDVISIQNELTSHTEDKNDDW